MVNYSSFATNLELKFGLLIFLQERLKIKADLKFADLLDVIFYSLIILGIN